MNEHWDEIMWAYVDGKVSSSEEKELTEKIAENKEMADRFKEIKSLHAQLREMPVIVADGDLSRKVMNTIANQEIEAQISTTHTPKEISLIPFILLVFGSLIVVGIMLLWLMQNSDVTLVIPEEFQLSGRKATLLGYTGFMLLCGVLMHRFAMGKKYR